MNLYFLPVSEEAMGDKILHLFPEYRGGVSDMPIWGDLRIACEKRGVEVHTADLWSREKSRPDDILLVQVHPDLPLLWRLYYFLKNPKRRGGFMLYRWRFFFENRKYFKRCVLLHTESPIVTPWVYNNIPKLLASKMYDKVMLFGPRTGNSAPDGYTRMDLYEIRDYSIVSPYFSNPKDKFVVMINSNTAPHSLRNELYGERFRAIRWFFEKNEAAADPDRKFDLYGTRWDRPPRHLLFYFYKKYIPAVWRGTTPDKMLTLSAYKFSICFENCIYPGYISEKIFDCMAAGTIPIYLGAPDITSVVPESCFIDFRKFAASDDKGYDYGKLYEYLVSLTPADLERYRKNIAAFLADQSTAKGMGWLAHEVCGD